MTEQGRKLSIYVAEFSTGGLDHTALFLVDEGGDAPEVLQQLHFNDNAEEFWDPRFAAVKYVPNVRVGLQKRQLGEDGLHDYPVIGGYEASVLPMWNHLLRHSLGVREDNVPFDYEDRHLVYASNCRTGIISALASIGIPYEEGMYSDDEKDRMYSQKAGTHGSRIQVKSVFSFATEPQATLEELRLENERLAEALMPPWDAHKGFDRDTFRALVHD